MTPSVSILMAFDCKCNLFAHEHFASAHTFHVELEFRIVGKTQVSIKKTSQSKEGENQQQTQPTLWSQLWYT